MQDGSENLLNYLVISDLHVQEADRSPTGRLFYFDDELADFLRYYVEEGRWRLILNGDFIEFFHIPVRPDPADPLLQGVTLYPTDFKFFPGTEWQKSVWKLQVALQGHPKVLEELARFIAAGNEIYLIRGNHDLEFCWPQVQEHFRLLVAQHHPPDLTLEAMQAIARERIRFLPWFYYVPGLLYVEHGHQYDAYCANAYNLHPVLPGNERRIELSISALSMRYFGSRMEVVDPIAMENVNSIPTYIWRLMTTNPGQVIKMPAYWAEMAWRILWKITIPSPQTDAAVRTVHEERRREVARAASLPLETVDQIGALAHPPVIRRWTECVKTTLADLVVGAALGIVGVIFLTLLFHPGWRWWGAGIYLLLVVFLALVGKNRLGKINDHRNLRDIAQRIHDILGVRYVLFGHSHNPDLAFLSPTGDHAYFNVGTWMPRSGGSQMIYFQLDWDEGGPAGRLMRWDRQERHPLEVDTTLAGKGPFAEWRWKRRLARSGAPPA